ncbi:MAG: hypothetical protein ABFS03_04800 [Chloroflexota bacterium]
MKHKPFENWILMQEPLLPDQAAALEEHLRDCQHCREIQQAIVGVEALFQNAIEVEPTPGFSQRWQNHLEQEQRDVLINRHRWHSWMALIILGNTIALSAFLLGRQLLSMFNSPAEFLLMWVYRLTSLISSITAARHLLSTLFNTLPGFVPLSAWLLIVGVSGLLALVTMTKLVQFSRRI